MKELIGARLALPLAVVLMVGCSAIQSPSATTLLVPSPSSSPTPAPTSAAPTQTSASAAPTWHKLADFQELGSADVRVDAVAWFKDRWVAIGEDTGPANQALAWWSSDGATWQPATISLPSGARRPAITAIAANADIAVAVGFTNVITAGGEIELARAMGAPAPALPGTARVDGRRERCSWRRVAASRPPMPQS